MKQLLGNVNSIDTNSINIKEITSIYKNLSEIVSNEDIADFIKDNSKVLTDAGMPKETLSASEKLLRTFDANTIATIVESDLDLNKLMNMYKNGDSIDKIIASIITDTSIKTKVDLAMKLVFSNFYTRFALFCLILLIIYSVFITGIIFKKAGRKSFITLIPLYRDIVHLKICHLSPWLLILLFIPILRLGSSSIYCNYWKI